MDKQTDIKPTNSVNWPSYMSKQACDSIWAQGKEQTLKSDQVLNQPSPHFLIIYVEKGAINLFSPSSEMESVVGCVITSGQWAITQLANLPGQQLQLSALFDSNIKIFEGQKLLKIQAQHPELENWITACQNSCSQQLLRSSLLAMQNKAALLAHTLHQLSQEHSDPRHPNRIVITQSQLSELLGTRRQSINEILQLFQLRNILKLGRGRIDILCKESLLNVSELKKEGQQGGQFSLVDVG
ncbi:helix-turn-helix domain-containing protein [Vibrio sp. SCSIO 43136]|uniref:Crp/Fnr family transcriptional regulator n=1 Tax=Vibrio sp. SCSIO 43136 TaxID=2819101 RepID=UPI00207629B6|nr:helix-turn-helix domain-containing protein [Vibrio sp. SCSIO 43136]USD65244.1 Crp/Fnr family transcriptional regulator [Vibrio sp. SCSIO 43136]